MTIGSVLVQPQRLRRAGGVSAEAAVVADLRTVVAAVAADARLAQPVLLPAALAAFRRLGERLGARLGPGAERAAERLTGLLDPLLQPVNALLEDAEANPQRLVTGLLDAAEQLAGAAGRLSVDGVAGILGTVLDTLTRDLGLTPEVVRDELLATLEDLATATASEHRELASALRRLRRRLAGLTLPDLDPQELARRLLERLRGRGADRAVSAVRCAAEGLRSATAAAGDVLDAVPFTGFASGSVGAAETGSASPGNEHAWYPTWLLGYKRPTGTKIGLTFVPFEGSDEVWVEDARRVVRRNKWRDDQPLGDGAAWPDALVFQSSATEAALAAHQLKGHYTFRRVQPDTMEAVALWSAVAVHGLEAVSHLWSLEEGDLASNIIGAFINTTSTIVNASRREPAPWWFEHLVGRTVLPLLASLESNHTQASARNNFLMWLTLAGPDLGEVVVYHLGLHAVRDWILSLLTLLNHEEPTGGGRRPQNRLEHAGWTKLFTALSQQIVWLILPREDYGLPFMDRDQTLRLILLWDLLLYPLFTVLGFTVGWFTARAIAGTRVAGDWGEFGEELGIEAAVAVLTFWPSLYMSMEGDTRDGRFNPDGADFPGYPDPATSPYRLPWTGGQLCYVGQANQGFFSHHPLTGQTYAYDFSLDQDAPVLASRPGTVDAFWDGTADDTEGRWNFVRIRHDRDDAGNPAPPDPAHDLDGGGAVVVTYAEYGHGRTNSVTQAFATRGIAPAAIPGAVVRRGDLIMRAGDTGRSFHNHLHMHVRPDNGAGAVDGNRTVPFVFREVAHDWRTFGLRNAGVPYRFDFYRSDNA